MLFPTIYITFSVYVIFFRQKIERVVAQRIVLSVMLIVLLLIFAISKEAHYIGWHTDRMMLLLASWWFLFCGFLLSLPMLNLQRWISQKLIFWLRDYLTIFSWVLLFIAFLAMVSALVT